MAKCVKIIFFVFLIFTDAATGYSTVKIPINYNTTCDKAVEKLFDAPASDFGSYIDSKLLGAYYCKDLKDNWYR